MGEIVSPEEKGKRVRRERWALLATLIRVTEQPMIVLSFVWVVLIIVDLVRGLNPLLLRIADTIWILFIADFLLKLAIAPDRLLFLRKNILTAVSIVLPAFRMLNALRVFKIFRLMRPGAVNMLRLITSTRRGMQALGTTLGRRGFGYVLAITALVIFLGAAGIHHYENPAVLAREGLEGRGIRSYGEGLWWTAMMMTTMGSDYWPQTAEGRILCWLLAVYAFTVFGYITATLASHFIKSDQADREKRHKARTAGNS